MTAAPSSQITARNVPAPTAGDPASLASGSFDGVICFGGEDWWYHNRGHYDMQMMRRFGRRVPTLYINSIGMRTPRPGEGAMFVRRVARKLRSLSRGVRRAEDFWVYSPPAAPGRLGPRVNRRVLPLAVRRAAARLGITRPLVWVACPPAVEAVDALRPAGVVYQRTDRFENFKGVDQDLIASFDRRLKRLADMTLFCSRHLFDAERDQCRRAAYVDHGVDYDRFALDHTPEDDPDDVRALPRPRVGFIGGIDAHTFDPALFVEVARSLPDASFVLVGSCSLPEGWCDLSNVHLLGQRPYEDVARYMAACDALIMPWSRNEWIEACNPVKLKEYLAAGRPVVSTPFPELAAYEGFVRIAETAGEFAQRIREAVETPGPAAPRRERVREETWDAKAERALATLRNEAGLEIVGGTGD